MNSIKESIMDLNLTESIKKEDFTKRMCLFICGTFINALSFSAFFSPYNIVTGGTTGLSLIVNEIKPLNTSIFVFALSSIILLLSFITLDFKTSIKTIFGVILYPIFLEFTKVFANYIDFSSIPLLLTVVMGAVLGGFSNGIIFKSGYSLGGTQPLYQILHKYLKISIGTSSLIINETIVLVSGFFFGFDNVLYAIIALYIGSVVTDKVLLGTSECKTFYIITEKEKEINEYIINYLKRSATILDAKGGYHNESKKVLMSAIPTREYFMLKEVVKMIDKNAFFVITDTYEVKGGR